MEILLTAHLINFVNSKVQEGGYEGASEVVREALRKFEAGARPVMGEKDTGAMAYIVSEEAAKNAQEDLKAIVSVVKAINNTKWLMRELLAKVQKDSVRNIGQVDGSPPLDFSTGLGSEENYHRVQMSVPEPQASTGVAFVPTNLFPGPITTISQIYAVVDLVKSKLDSLSEMGETESLRLQMAMDRMSKMMSTLSHLLKIISDTAQGITQNLK